VGQTLLPAALHQPLSTRSSTSLRLRFVTLCELKFSGNSSSVQFFGSGIVGPFWADDN
jgi:hypothetical protein